MFSTFIPRYSSFLPPESGIIFIVFTMRTYANFDKIQNYILLNFDKYDFTNNAHIPVASSRQKRLDFSRITTYSRTSATAGAVYLPKANTEGGAAGYNRGGAPRHR